MSKISLSRRSGSVLAAALAVISFGVAPAAGGAERDGVPNAARADGPPRADGPARADGPPQAEFHIVSPGPGASLSGYVGPESMDPLHGYVPRGYSPRDFHRRVIRHAGIIRGIREDGKLVRAYCFDLEHPTRGHMPYRYGTWGEARTRNLGYIARTIHDYYPNTAEPAGMSERAKAAAVQAAIWFFSNRYVLDQDHPLFPTTSRIVSRVIKEGPLEEPASPSLRVSGPEHVRANSLAGPYSVEGTSDKASVDVTGGEMYRDAAGTQPIRSGAPLERGASFYLRSAHPGKVRVRIRARVVHHIGQAAVYVREAGYPGMPREGQKIILAREDCVDVVIEKLVVIEEELPPPPPVEHHPSLEVHKWVHPGTYGHAGQRLHFKIKVTNTGDVALNNVRVEDHMRGLSEVRCPRTTLAAGESMVCSATYRVTRRDLRHHSVKNCAAAEGRAFEEGTHVRSGWDCAQAYGHVPVTG
ncbi:hypothetical protein DZF91_00455 [Actinomadura logoneensis]|uniref:Uncharacterized protein n=1 Tax=Actinomadura logoneensis TaxID=2293572 RepID=A0A372JU92_9ACTN|nr:Cys-Gln thioester bond-forming surface protein [Actinomadura logoneensis]RFU43595.1 hypothetical protein DZF91_00455 [Actinomadura logoneensis]